MPWQNCRARSGRTDGMFHLVREKIDVFINPLTQSRQMQKDAGGLIWGVCR